ncbi:MAG: hypothetical protein O2954_09775 [bacterium]|nr:hypothetical protein [bacterium]
MRCLLIACYFLIIPGLLLSCTKKVDSPTANENVATPEPVKGWAGKYRGTGTIIREDYTSGEAPRLNIEPFHTVDTLRLNYPLTLEMDSLAVLVTFDDDSLGVSFVHGPGLLRTLTEERFLLTQYYSHNIVETCGFIKNLETRNVEGSIRYDFHSESTVYHWKKIISIRAKKSIP